MSDLHSTDVDPVRRRIMSSVRSKDTKPEMMVRRLLHARGFRFRLHRKDLAGNPDIVFGPRRKVIFVHGCFWHRHQGCPKATTPRKRADFWREKFARNVERDAEALKTLKDDGWEALVVWECETKDQDDLMNRLSRFLGNKDDRRSKGYNSG